MTFLLRVVLRGWIFMHLALTVHVAAAETVKPAAYFVAPTGNDANPGTEDRPFGTLQRAQTAVRQHIAGGSEGDVTVLIAAGTYELPETLVFGAEDSAGDHAVVYQAAPSAKVVLSGGRRINGWRQGKGPIWTAEVPGAAGGKWHFRSLFVNNRRAIRARIPNAGEQPDCRQLTAVEFSKDHSHFAVETSAGLLEAWKTPGDIEMMIAGNWAINRKRVERIEPEANRITLAPPHRHGPQYIFPSAKRWFHIENARELLDEPGEWHLDRQSGLLSYWPRPGEDLSQIAVVAPRLSQLVVVRGTADRPVRNLHFAGLSFEHTDWELPEHGYMGIQACHYGHAKQPGRRWSRIPAAVCFTAAEGCSVTASQIAHLGTSGLELADRASNNSIEGNQLSDISANGIMVGGPQIEVEVPVANRVSNNHVHGCGREYYGAIGIWVGFARRTVVSHNLVHDLPYSGISIGWEWNDQPTPCRENLVEWNHVHDVMNRLCDGGCIYTLGFQPGTVIRGNHLHGVHRSALAQGAPNNGMFIDQGSKGYLFERNVIYDTAAEHVRFNQCQRDWHEWRDNHFGEPAEVRQSGSDIIAKAGLDKH